MSRFYVSQNNFNNKSKQLRKMDRDGDQEDIKKNIFLIDVRKCKTTRPGARATERFTLYTSSE